MAKSIADALRAREIKEPRDGDENRSDGAMIRVITSIMDGENELSAQDRAVQFTSQLVPTLSSYIPQ